MKNRFSAMVRMLSSSCSVMPYMLTDDGRSLIERLKETGLMRKLGAPEQSEP